MRAPNLPERCMLPCGQMDSPDPAHIRVTNHLCVRKPNHEGLCDFIGTCKQSLSRARA